MKIKRYGWIPDAPDSRDIHFATPLYVDQRAELPKKVSLRAQMPSIWNQGELGSCTAHGILACDLFCAMKQNSSRTMLSRLMLYWLERHLEGTLQEDAGAQIRDGIKALAKWGSCHEELWPYEIARFREQPTPAAFADAEKHQALEYRRIYAGDMYGMRKCLADGFPFTFGFAVFAQFESEQCAKDGLVRFPSMLELPIGGHCVAAIGYDDERAMVECRNSWGEHWGDAGNFWMPYSCFKFRGMVTDLWTIRRVENEACATPAGSEPVNASIRLNEAGGPS